jgi:HD-GYP domain-containing protein (c-di-GMP phosphodiesterase class II)
MAKDNGSRAFRPEDTTTDIRNALQRERKVKADFISDIRDAAKLHGRARANLTRLGEDMRARRPLHMDVTKEVAHAMFDSLITNPNVLLWMTNMQMPKEHHACHSFNVSVLSMIFGKHRGMTRSEMLALGTGGLLHDIGKTHIPAPTLDKRAKLTDVERALVRKHAKAGYDALLATKQLTNDILDIVRDHHERADGNGYPEGLFGDSVPESARMVAITDAYDSMTGGYYRPAMTPTDALQVLKTQASEEYGEDLVEDFIRCLGTYPVGSLVELNSGALVMVVASNSQARLKPKVMLLCNEEGKFEKPRMLTDLADFTDQDLSDRWGIRGLVDPTEAGIDVRGVVLEEIQF